MRTKELPEKWIHSKDICTKYDLDCSELKQARENGLPFRMSPGGGRYYYRERDIHDYYSGRIGNDVKPLPKSPVKRIKRRCKQ